MYIINSFLSSTPLVIPFLSIQLFSPLQARFLPVVDSTLLRANEARISRPRTSVQGQVRGSQRYESTDKVDGRKVYKRTRQLQRRARKLDLCRLQQCEQTALPSPVYRCARNISEQQQQLGHVYCTSVGSHNCLGLH